MAGEGGFFAGSIYTKMTMDKSAWDSSMKGVKGQVEGMKAPVGGLAGAFSGLSGQFAVGALMAQGLQQGLRFVVRQLGSCITEAIEAENVVAQLDAVLKSTGGSAGMSKDELIKLSRSLQDVTTTGDDTILSAENLLLTFTAIGRDVFPQAVETMLDMSKALGQDLKNSAIQLGKALQDPILGITALRRVGVNFNDAQKDIIAKLVETGDMMAAQKLILKELSTEFGGSARAAAETYGGRLAQLKNVVADLKEELGKALIPVLKRIVESITPIVRAIGDWLACNQDLISDTFALVGDIGDLAIKIGEMGSIVGILDGRFKNLKITLGDIMLGPGGKLLAFIVETNHKMRDAERQTERLADQQDKAKAILRAWSRENGIGVETLNALAKAYDGNYVAMHNAVMEMKVGQGLQESLVDWHKKMAEAANGGGAAAGDLTEVAKRLGFTLRDDVIAEIKATEAALAQLKSTAGAATPGAINALNEKLDKLREYLTGTKKRAGETVPPMRDLADAIKEVRLESALSYKPLTDLGPAMDIAKQRAIDFTNAGLFLIPEGFKAAGNAIDGLDGELKESESSWANFAQTVGSKIGDILGECLKLPKFIDDAFSDLPPIIGKTLKTIYDAFATFVADLIAKWVTEFLIKHLVGSTAEAAAKATDSLVGIGKKVMETTGDVAAGAAKTATGAISGVATSLVNTISGIVTAVASILSLFKKADYSSITYWLKPMSERLQEIRDYLFIVLEGQHLGYMHDIMVDDNKVGWDLVYKGQAVIEILSSGFAAVVDAIKGIKSYQGGGYVPRTGLAFLHAGETVLRSPSFDSMRFPSPSASSGGQAVHLYFEGEEVDLGLERGVRRAVVKLVPELTKKEQIKLHMRAQRRF